MKKFYCIMCMFLPMVASADALDDKINRLTQEKLQKIAQLEECQKNTKGLKIAGITTLGVSAIGIGANIGEAVALKKLDGKIDAAEQEMSDLDIKIQEKQRQQDLLKPENNTCGVRECGTSKENFLANAIGAADAVCVDANWFPTSCKEGYEGTQKTCKSNGQVVDYVLHCNKIEQNKSGDVIPDCGEQNKCGDLTAAQLLTNLNATKLVCVNGVSKPTDCYSQGEPTGKKQCKNGNVVITYYDACPGTSVKKTTRKNGDLCTDDESAKVLYAQETFWQNGKCVAKSCQDGKFLSVENGVSLGECVTACSSYQIIDWSAGGKACDTSLQFNPTENCARKVFSRAEYTKNMCYGKCQEYAHENNCKLTGDPIENQQTGECICNPVPQDLNKPGGVVELPACQEQEVEKNSKSECDTHCTQYANNNKCKLTRGNTYYSDTKQCFCNAAAPRKREVEQKNLCSETSIVSVSASNCMSLCSTHASRNNCTVENTSWDGVNCYCNPTGGRPAADWDLVSKVAPQIVQPTPDMTVQWPACQEQEVEKNSKSECDAHCEQYANNNRCKLTRGNTYYSDTKQCFCNAAAPRKREVEQKNLCSETSIVSVSASNCMSLCSTHASRNNCTVENTSWDGVNCYCNPAGGRPVADWDLVSKFSPQIVQKNTSATKAQQNQVTEKAQTPCAAYERNLMVADLCDQTCAEYATNNKCTITSASWNNGVCYCNSTAGHQNKPVWSLF